jgi:hypothetical protein
MNPTKKAEIAGLDECTNLKINTPIESVWPLPPKDLFNYEDDELTEPIDKGLVSLELQDATPAKLDEYLTAQLLLPVGGERVPVTVLKQKLDSDDNPIRERNSNPKCDTQEYDVQLPDGSTDTFAANTIAENHYAQIDAEGRAHTVFKDIVNHRCNEKTFLDKYGQINLISRLLDGNWRFNGLMVPQIGCCFKI